MFKGQRVDNLQVRLPMPAKKIFKRTSAQASENFWIIGELHDGKNCRNCLIWNG